jgi:signal transduction histidine kinase
MNSDRRQHLGPTDPAENKDGQHQRSRSSDGSEREPLPDRVTSLTETNRQLKRRIFDLYTIFEISRDFNSVLDYKTLLDTFILTSLAQVGASKAAIFLPADNNPERYVLTRRKGSGRFPDRRQCFQAGSTLLTYMTKLNRPVTTGELMGEMALRGERSILSRFHPGLAVPIIYQTQLRAVLLVTDKVGDRDFAMEDVEFLSVLGNQISVAIENSRLYEAERMATRQLQAAQDKLVRTERLAALGEMSARVAHEVNNPLGIIKNYLQLISRATVDNVESKNYVDIVGQEIDRIARIVRELLAFHRPHSPELEEVDLKTLIEDVLNLMSRQFSKLGIEVVTVFEDDSPTIMGAPENLKQVLLNIMLNAADAMPSGGQFKVMLRCCDDKLEIDLIDTGPGIKPENIARIFEPFFTTKESGRGTGLGLSVCYGIIKRHQGTIRYNNTINGGCFTILLPAERSSDVPK